MIYLTVRPTTGGNHGHQLKDLIGGITISKVFGFTYVHTYYPYLEFFGLGLNEKSVMDLPEDMDYIKLGGPFWGGISYENLHNMFDPIVQKYQDKDCLLSIEQSLRLFPFQTINWYKEGLVDANIFDTMFSEISEKFSEKHKNRPTYFDTAKINVAVHISRGQDYDREKFPMHFADHTKVRYMFPIQYWENIINQISSFFVSDYTIHIYTEQFNSEEIVNAFEKREDVILHIGTNRSEGNTTLAHDIFYHFVQADLLVACNSSFSSMACYFRKNKLTIYHPHDHLATLPEDVFLATTEEGDFDNNRQKELVAHSAQI